MFDIAQPHGHKKPNPVIAISMQPSAVPVVPSAISRIVDAAEYITEAVPKKPTDLDTFFKCFALLKEKHNKSIHFLFDAEQ